MNPLVLPLSIGKDDTFRVSWKNRFFTARGALVLPRKITTELDAQEILESTQLVVKLAEFKDALRNKLLAALAPQNEEKKSVAEIFGVVLQVNIKTGRMTAVDDLRRTQAEGGGESADFMADDAEVLALSDAERDELIVSFNRALTAPVLEALRQTFVPFSEEISDAWKQQDLRSIQPDKLVPFQMLFPNGQPIERFVDGERYVIDDLYCTNPSCNCTDVTCVVLKMLPASGTEVAWGGFKWNIEADKFRPLPQFSNKFNASEWFKQFNAASAIDLKLLLSSRQKFMRTRYIAERKALR
ncbi:MAG: hypothetical protein RLZZ488_1813 [Pseudomonadota bacterium]|jgi:hypothetical protein